MSDVWGSDPIDVTAPPTPTWVLDAATLNPEAMSAPCPSRAVAHLGFERGVVVPCGLSVSHEGLHRYLIEWSDARV